MSKLKDSFIELSGRERAKAILDSGAGIELLDPFEGVKSPHLEPQGIVPQNDDGVIVIKGEIDGERVVVISIEGAFQGGGIGEVSGAKIAGALELALKDNREGKKIVPVVVFDTGGVRLQEANYGLLSIAEIQGAIVALNEYVPTIGIIPGKVGGFGGMSITAALFSHVMITPSGRYGLNGPEVIEQEAGVRELDSSDKKMIWEMIGGTQRVKTGLVDTLVEDDIDEILSKVKKAMKEHPVKNRTEEINFYLTLINKAFAQDTFTPKDYEKLYYHLKEQEVEELPKERVKASDQKEDQSRGRKWFEALTNVQSPSGWASTVLSHSNENENYIAVVPDSYSRFKRARHGEVGLYEGWKVAQTVQEFIKRDEKNEKKRAIIAVIDVPSQAYGYKEEVLGINVALAASVNMLAKARLCGHPVIGFIPGKAISGAFLALGLQANVLLSIDDDKINVQAMSKKSAARITKRTIRELEEATKKVPAMAYDIHSYKTLGALSQLITNINGDHPSEEDIHIVKDALITSIHDVQSRNDRSLSIRLETKEALLGGRKASIEVRERMKKQWN